MRRLFVCWRTPHHYTIKCTVKNGFLMWKMYRLFMTRSASISCRSQATGCSRMVYLPSLQFSLDTSRRRSSVDKMCFAIHCDESVAIEIGESYVILIRKMYCFIQLPILDNYFHPPGHIAPSHLPVCCEFSIKLTLNAKAASHAMSAPKPFGQSNAICWSMHKRKVKLHLVNCGM